MADKCKLPSHFLMVVMVIGTVVCTCGSSGTSTGEESKGASKTGRSETASGSETAGAGGSETAKDCWCGNAGVLVGYAKGSTVRGKVTNARVYGPSCACLSHGVGKAENSLVDVDADNVSIHMTREHNGEAEGAGKAEGADKGAYRAGKNGEADRDKTTGRDMTTLAEEESESADENSRISLDEQSKLFKKHKPLHPPEKGSHAHMALSSYCSGVEIILHTVNDNEYQAAVTMMKPPSDTFERAVVFPSAGTVVGMFAGKKTALIQTDVGSNLVDYVQDAIDTFPNATFAIGIGVGYAFDRVKHKLGDVLVSQKISDLRNLKFNSAGDVIDRGETINVVNTLVLVFCKDLTFDEDFIVSDRGRFSKVYAGRYASYTALMNNKEMRAKFRDAVPEVIGGEMEGGELMRFQQRRKIEGIIVIKGVADYGDGTKSKTWQFTAAMAALKYAETKLKFYQKP